MHDFLSLRRRDDLPQRPMNTYLLHLARHALRDCLKILATALHEAPNLHLHKEDTKKTRETLLHRTLLYHG